MSLLFPQDACSLRRKTRIFDVKICTSSPCWFFMTLLTVTIPRFGFERDGLRRERTREDSAIENAVDCAPLFLADNRPKSVRPRRQNGLPAEQSEIDPMWTARRRSRARGIHR